MGEGRRWIREMTVKERKEMGSVGKREETRKQGKMMERMRGTGGS